MKPKTIAITALIALGIVIGYDVYKSKRTGG